MGCYATNIILKACGIVWSRREGELKAENCLEAKQCSSLPLWLIWVEICCFATWLVSATRYLASRIDYWFLWIFYLELLKCCSSHSGEKISSCLMIYKLRLIAEMKVNIRNTSIIANGLLLSRAGRDGFFCLLAELLLIDFMLLATKALLRLLTESLIVFRWENLGNSKAQIRVLLALRFLGGILYQSSASHLLNLAALFALVYLMQIFIANFL